MKTNRNLAKAVQTLLASDDEVLDAELAEALAEAGVIFACSLQSSVRFELAHDGEIQIAKTAIPSVEEILDTGAEENRRTRLRTHFVSVLKNDGMTDSPVEFAQAARNLQSALPNDIQLKMRADRDKAEIDVRD